MIASTLDKDVRHYPVYVNTFLNGFLESPKVFQGVKNSTKPNFEGNTDPNYHGIILKIGMISRATHAYLF